MKINSAFTQILLFLLLATFSCQEQSPQKHYLSFTTPEELQNYLAWAPEKTPLIGAHRGGPLPGFPENCIESFDNILSYAPCLIECDVRKTKDGVLIMMHDEMLERTTNGSGNITDFTWDELKMLQLEDNDGKLTDFRIPTLADVLDWGRDKAIIQLDVKRGIQPPEIVEAISRQQAEAYVVVITYTLDAAKEYHRLNPNLMISASASGPEGTTRLLNSNIRKQNLVAFVGVFEPPAEIYDMLHQNGIRAILGTLGNLDRKAEKEGISVYLDLLKNGADILATDNVPMVTEVIERYVVEKR